MTKAALTHEGFVRHIDENRNPTINLLGPTVQFLSRPKGDGCAPCVMKAVLPPGQFVPLHSHEDVEEFFLLAGQQEVLLESQGKLEWTVCNPGDFIYIPGGTRHAFRNKGPEPAVSLCITTAKLARFFEEVGANIHAHPLHWPPTGDAAMRFIQVATRYGYRLAAPEENVAAGIAISQGI